ncbi:hypothetical protein [Microbacterium gorillae]|uniref:hypothetical protein n=1 Tax=Microbacterium gorillae TaxID=1231063 RepID=UPI003D957205
MVNDPDPQREDGGVSPHQPPAGTPSRPDDPRVMGAEAASASGIPAAPEAPAKSDGSPASADSESAPAPPPAAVGVPPAPDSARLANGASPTPVPDGPERPGSRYVTSSDGAPPVPPPGGYRGARNPDLEKARHALVSPVDLLARPVASPAPVADGPRPLRRVGIVALVAAIGWAVVLLGALAVSATDFLFNLNVVVIQLLIVGVIVASVILRDARRLGGIALAIALVFNVVTIGGVSAVRTAAQGSYEGQKTEQQKLWERYPGVKGMSTTEIKAQPSLEEVRARTEEILTAVRERLSADYGVTWVQQPVPEDISPERNGYGGESMLRTYTSTIWSTNEAITDNALKLQMMHTIDDVLFSYGMSQYYPVNDPAESTIDPSIIEKMFGSTDPDLQAQWEWASYDYDTGGWFYGDLYDLSKDTTGRFRTERQADHDRTGVPMEGLSIMLRAEKLLSESDVATFDQRMSEYE